MNHTVDDRAFVLADRDNQAPRRKLAVAEVDLAACPYAHGWSKRPSNFLEVAANGLFINTVPCRGDSRLPLAGAFAFCKLIKGLDLSKFACANQRESSF